MESENNKAEVLTVSRMCKVMGPAQRVTIREADDSARSGERDLFTGNVAQLRRQAADLLRREVKHITTLQDDQELSGNIPADPRKRKGICMYIYGG